MGQKGGNECCMATNHFRTAYEPLAEVLLLAERSVGVGMG